MWLDKLKELKKKSGMTAKQIAEKAHMSERTASRILSGETFAPGIDKLRDMVYAMGGSLDDILDESDFKLPIPEIDALNEEIAKLSLKIEEMTMNETVLNAEIDMMKGKICSLTAENDLLRMKLEHKEEIISLHNYYNKLKAGN